METWIVLCFDCFIPVKVFGSKIAAEVFIQSCPEIRFELYRAYKE